MAKDIQYKKRYSTSLIIRKMQIKTTSGHYLTPLRMDTYENGYCQKDKSASDDVKKGTLYAVVGDIN